MKFRTEMPPEPRLSGLIAHDTGIMLLGSCFSDNIGARLAGSLFDVSVNPLGTLYNPLSIRLALDRIISGRPLEAGELVTDGRMYHSFLCHSSLSSSSAEKALMTINSRLAEARGFLGRASVTVITFGTAWVYHLASTGEVVANCHKFPASMFDRRCLTADEASEAMFAITESLLKVNPEMKVIFTVSPIRHLADGFHGNTLSKATLHMAVSRVTARYPHSAFYFPAYEALMDDLRDYRFYAEDMVHPSPQAAGFVWERFAQLCLTDQARDIMREAEHIKKALSHKPFHPGSAEHKHFLEQIVLKIDRLNQKYPYLDFQNEKEICRTQLNE